jgi:hypothetical protein
MESAQIMKFVPKRFGTSFETFSRNWWNKKATLKEFDQKKKKFEGLEIDAQESITRLTRDMADFEKNFKERTNNATANHLKFEIDRYNEYK